MQKLLYLLPLVFLLAGCSATTPKENPEIKQPVINQNISGNFITTGSNSSITGSIITGESHQLTGKKEDVINTGAVIKKSGDGVIKNIVSDSVKKELEKLYGRKIKKLDVQVLGDYIVGEGEEYNDGPGSLFIILAGKINNKWYKFYEGNSGDISCKIVEWGFPKILIDVSNMGCYQTGADYTIPEETAKVFNK